MTISLHTTRTSAPNTAAATSVSPLEQSGSSKTKFSKTRKDIYQTVTDNIIAALEAGVKPWSCCVFHSVRSPFRMAARSLFRILPDHAITTLPVSF